VELLEAEKAAALSTATDATRRAQAAEEAAAAAAAELRAAKAAIEEAAAAKEKVATMMATLVERDSALTVVSEGARFSSSALALTRSVCRVTHAQSPPTRSHTKLQLLGVRANPAVCAVIGNALTQRSPHDSPW